MIDNKRHTVRLISTRLGPTTESDPGSRPNRGRPALLLVGGPLSRSAMNRRWGLGLETRGSQRPPVPTDILTLVRSRGRAVSDGKHSRPRYRSLDSTTPHCVANAMATSSSSTSSTKPKVWASLSRFHIDELYDVYAKLVKLTR